MNNKDGCQSGMSRSGNECVPEKLEFEGREYTLGDPLVICDQNIDIANERKRNPYRSEADARIGGRYWYRQGYISVRRTFDNGRHWHLYLHNERTPWKPRTLSWRTRKP